MILTNIAGEVISIILIVLIISSVIIYIVRAKQKGVKCIGCPDAKKCSAKNLKEKCCAEVKKVLKKDE
jgi:hypothetical protein